MPNIGLTREVVVMSKTMDIEVVDIRKINGEGNTRAFADLKVGEGLVVKGFTVMLGKRGVFVNMPRKVTKDGKWFDVVTPANEIIKRQIEEKVLEAYDRETDGVKN